MLIILHWTNAVQVSKSQDQDNDAQSTPEEKSSAEGKDEHGEGRAEDESGDTEGHSGNFGKAKTSGSRKKEEKRERPGQSETERSLGIFI